MISRNQTRSSVLLACICVASSAFATQHDWQIGRLLTPKPTHLAKERQGQVFIYDGLREAHVNTALDTHFDRIDSMMFIRILRTPTAAGAAPEVDDDCD